MYTYTTMYTLTQIPPHNFYNALFCIYHIEIFERIVNPKVLGIPKPKMSHYFSNTCLAGLLFSWKSENNVRPVLIVILFGISKYVETRSVCDSYK